MTGIWTEYVALTKDGKEVKEIGTKDCYTDLVSAIDERNATLFKAGLPLEQFAVCRVRTFSASEENANGMFISSTITTTKTVIGYNPSLGEDGYISPNYIKFIEWMAKEK